VTDSVIGPVSAVLSSFNKRDHVLANVRSLLEQSRRPAQIVVVDNASSDGTAEALRREFPPGNAPLVVIEMPHSRFGACETFNLGFRAATEEFVAILDDDVVLPPNWIERLLDRFAREPATTGLITTLVVEPGMPDDYLARPDVNQERYLSTFRGCGSLVRRDLLLRAGLYDERFFIYGNERDLAARLLSLGSRILLDPTVVTFHATPFGLKAGKRSLYFHVRNFWLYAFKNCSWPDVFRAAFAMARKGLGGKRKAVRGDATAAAHEAELEATGTMGLSQAIKETPGAWWIVVRATFAALGNLPYCLARRSVVRAPDFRLPGL